METASASHHTGDENRIVRKRLVSSNGTVNIHGQNLPNLAGKVVNAVLCLENGPGTTSTGAKPTTPGKVPIVKRRKQEEKVGGEGMELSSQAASDREAAEHNEDPMLELSWDWRSRDSSRAPRSCGGLCADGTLHC